jgi:hypothetical protein
MMQEGKRGLTSASTIGQIIAPGGYGVSPFAFSASDHTEAVVLDLVQPRRVGRQLRGICGRPGAISPPGRHANPRMG